MDGHDDMPLNHLDTPVCRGKHGRGRGGDFKAARGKSGGSKSKSSHSGGSKSKSSRNRERRSGRGKISASKDNSSKSKSSQNRESKSKSSRAGGIKGESSKRGDIEQEGQGRADDPEPASPPNSRASASNSDSDASDLEPLTPASVRVEPGILPPIGTGSTDFFGYVCAPKSDTPPRGGTDSRLASDTCGRTV